MEDLGLVVLMIDDWMLVQRGSFDFYLDGEPHHSLHMLINISLGKYVTRVWSRTYDNGDFKSTEELKSILYAKPVF